MEISNGAGATGVAGAAAPVALVVQGQHGGSTGAARGQHGDSTGGSEVPFSRNILPSNVSSYKHFEC